LAPGDPSSPCAVLLLLGRLYRERRTGVLSLGPGDQRLDIALRDGQIVGVLPPAGAPPAPAAAASEPEWTLPRPDDSARLKLDRVLAEIGIRPAKGRAKAPAPTPSLADWRERLLETLASGREPAGFDERTELPAGVWPTAGTTEPLILEAVRRVRDADAVRAACGDLDQLLVATSTLAQDRTLTLTEGYLLSRVDGLCTARQVLQLVPSDAGEAERTLLGLLLTGRVGLQPAPVRSHGRAALASPHEPVAAPASAREAPQAEASPAEAALPSLPMDPEILDRRREILEIFQSLPLRNHFEVLGVEPGCTENEVKRAYVVLAKRFHPDVHRDPRLEDLHDVLEAIFIRVGEAWEVLGDPRSRAAYESRFGPLPVLHPTVKIAPPVTNTPPSGNTPPFAISQPASAAPLPAVASSPTPAPPPSSEPDEEAVFQTEDVLWRVKNKVLNAQYWDAIQILEPAVPHLQPRRQQIVGRVLLAKLYAKNPNWLRRAEDTLQDVLREDPANFDAHYELGLLYKASGFAARAQAEFRKAAELRPDHRGAAAEVAAGEPPAGGGLLKRIFGRGKAS